jgi:hypothetical protein
MCGKPWMRSIWRAGTDAAAAGRSPTPSTRTRPVLGGPSPAARLARVVSVVSRTVALVTRTSRQRPVTMLPDIDAEVLKLEFQNRWEGPGAPPQIADGVRCPACGSVNIGGSNIRPAGWRAPRSCRDCHVTFDSDVRLS